MTILSSIMQFAMLPLQGFTQGGQPIISFNYGAGDMKRVRRAFQMQTACCLIYAFVLWAAVELFPGLFVAIFTNDPQLAQITKWALRIYMACVVLMASRSPASSPLSRLAIPGSARFLPSSARSSC